jgi:transketolase
MILKLLVTFLWERVMNESSKFELQTIANTIRKISIESIQRANSGHPGLPLGCAELGAYIYGVLLNHNPRHSSWMNRDRFVLSAGHGSMFLYSCLHLAGFKLSIEDIKRFRQLYSQTPGHPEVNETDGVETTSGPLGQGVANAVGMALGQKILAEKFNTDEFKIFDNKIYCLAGDGCIMEGVSSEASSLAGHLKLDNLVLIYDANNITLDGPLSDSFSEDVKSRYRAYGWDVYEIDGHDFDAIDVTFREIKENQKRPAFVMAHTIIGKGSPNKAGSHKVHGSPLGEEEVLATNKSLNITEDPFSIPSSVRRYFDGKLLKQAQLENEWDDTFRKWSQANHSLKEELDKMQSFIVSNDLEIKLKNLEMKNPVAGRGASYAVINMLVDIIPNLYGGSADLSSSDKTSIDKYGYISSPKYQGRNIKFGAREFAMAAIANGLTLTKMFIPFVGTFLTFSDYMKNAIRIASISSLKVIYQFTHDSIFVGEDGPTHQPIEQLASLRSIPNLQVIRPSDANEVKMAWLAALKYEGPTALILSRQSLPDLKRTDVSYEEGVGRGAYILKKETKKPDYTIFASGSEVVLALEVAGALNKLDKDVRVISFPSWEIFERQPQEYRDKIVKGDLGKRVSIEAGVDLGWHKYIGLDGIAIALDSFGFSAPPDDLAIEFGFTVDSILQRII